LTINRQLFSARFRKLRRDLGLSQRNLSKNIGLKGNTQVSKFERGASEPSLEVLRKLAEIRSVDIQIDLHDLVTGKTSPAVEVWKQENKTLLELLAKYISSETARLLDERHKLWGELGMIEDAKAKQKKGVVGKDGAITFLKAEIARIEKQIADVAEDQDYVKRALFDIIH